MAQARTSNTKANTAKDKILTDAIELALEVVLHVAEKPEYVGAYLGAEQTEERLVTHYFACEMKGYKDWRWLVSLSRAPRDKKVTVCDSVLVPGEGSLLASEWIPWEERLQASDLSPTDILPFKSDDPRLEAGYTPQHDGSEEDAVAIEELALARQRVLSVLGKEQVADRWYNGSQGPQSLSSEISSQQCMSCGFFLPIEGDLKQLFGVCANEIARDDGQVVSGDHGCGAHSETDVPYRPTMWPDPDPLVDETQVDVVEPGVPEELGIIEVLETVETEEGAELS